MRNFILVLVLACLPAAIIGAGIYAFGTDPVEKVVNSHYEEQFGQVAGGIDEALSHIEISVTRWGRHSALDNKLRDIGVRYDPFHIGEIYNLLFIMKGSSPYVQDVFLYLGGPEWVVSDSLGVVRLENEALQRTYRELMDYPELIYWTERVPHFADSAAGGHVALVHKLPITSTEAAGFLVVLVNGEKLSELVNHLTPLGKDGISLLLDAEGERIGEAGPNEAEDERAAALRGVIKEAQRNGMADGSFVYHRDKTAYSVSFGQMRRIGAQWTFASAVSMEELTAPVLRISRIIVWISLIGLLAAIVLSWFVSNRVYQPIRHLMALFARGEEPAGAAEARNEVEFIVRKWNLLSSERERLQEQLKLHMPGMREGFLLQLVQGHLYSLTEAELHRRMEQLDWELDGKSFTAVAVRLLGFSRLSGRFREGDEPLVTFAAANIAKELAVQRFGQAEAINFQNLTIGLLLIHDSALPERRIAEMLDALAGELTSALNQWIKMNVLIGLGATASSVSELPSVLESAVQTTQFGDLDEGNQIRTVGDYSLAEEGAKWVYPFAVENDLLQSLRSGNEPHSAEALRRFVRTIHEHGGNEFHVRQALLQLLGNLQFALLKMGINPYAQMEGMNPFEQLSAIREADEMLRWFQTQIVGPYIQEVRKAADQQSSQTLRQIERVIETLKRDYASDISLESCAEQHQINVFTLSKAFKQSTGMTFVEYLTRLRLEKAKELLGGTSMKINEIAERVGYQGTYFNRIFKKVEGITPSQYRELHQEGEGQFR